MMLVILSGPLQYPPGFCWDGDTKEVPGPGGPRRGMAFMGIEVRTFLQLGSPKQGWTKTENGARLEHLLDPSPPPTSENYDSTVLEATADISELQQVCGLCKVFMKGKLRVKKHQAQAKVS